MEFKEPFNIIILEDPRTKKNSSRIVVVGKRKILLPSKAYVEFEKKCKKYLPELNINFPINLDCKFYMKTRRKVDLNNLLSAITDVLVKYKVIVDDNKNIITGFDGSRVYYDPHQPRIEISITKGK